MADFPAMPLFTDSYLADTRHLTTTEHGAYLLLLFEAWRRPNCSLPDNPKLLARLTCLSDDEWSEISDNVMAFFSLDKRAKEWTQKKQLKIRRTVAEKSAKQRDRIASRWNKKKKPDTAVIPERYRSDTGAIPTKTKTKTKEKNHTKKSCEAVVELWNSFAEKHDLQPVVGLTTDRLNQIPKRIDQAGGSIEDFEKVLTRAGESYFLLGGGERGWKLNFDGLLGEQLFQKIMEGVYDNRGARRKANGRTDGRPKSKLDHYVEKIMAEHDGDPYASAMQAWRKSGEKGRAPVMNDIEGYLDLLGYDRAEYAEALEDHSRIRKQFANGRQP